MCHSVLFFSTVSLICQLPFSLLHFHCFLLSFRHPACFYSLVLDSHPLLPFFLALLYLITIVAYCTCASALAFFSCFPYFNHVCMFDRLFWLSIHTEVECALLLLIDITGTLLLLLITTLSCTSCGNHFNFSETRTNLSLALKI